MQRGYLLHPIGGVLLETELDRELNRARNLGPPPRDGNGRLLEDRRHQRGRGRTLEGPIAGQHFVEQQTQLVDVARDVDRLGTDLFERSGRGLVLTEQGRRLALLKPHRRILNLLKLTKLDEVFAIYDDREQALGELGAG